MQCCASIEQSSGTPEDGSGLGEKEETDPPTINFAFFKHGILVPNQEEYLRASRFSGSSAPLGVQRVESSSSCVVN